MTPVLLDALLGLFSFAGLATLAVSRHQAEWRAVGSALRKNPEKYLAKLRGK